LRVAAIEAAGSIHPREAQEILRGLTADRDEEIAEAATDAIELATGMIEAGDDSDDEKGDWIN
jgi:HEAT repeat protein